MLDVVWLFENIQFPNTVVSFKDSSIFLLLFLLPFSVLWKRSWDYRHLAFEIFNLNFARHQTWLQPTTPLEIFRHFNFFFFFDKEVERPIIWRLHTYRPLLKCPCLSKFPSFSWFRLCVTRGKWAMIWKITTINPDRAVLRYRLECRGFNSTWTIVGPIWSLELVSTSQSRQIETSRLNRFNRGYKQTAVHDLQIIHYIPASKMSMFEQFKTEKPASSHID